MTDHPVTPPSQLLQLWFEQHDLYDKGIIELLIEAARYGADQELEACCADVRTVYGKLKADWLRSMRRPKPPSLKEQALALLQPGEPRLFNSEMQDTIRRALEALPE